MPLKSHVPPSWPGEIPCPFCGFIGGYHITALHPRRKPIAGLSRREIHERDGYICQGCHKQLSERHPELTIDHKIPRSRGGTNNPDNLQTMCEPCNNAKADRMPTPS